MPKVGRNDNTNRGWFVGLLVCWFVGLLICFACLLVCWCWFVVSLFLRFVSSVMARFGLFGCLLFCWWWCWWYPTRAHVPTWPYLMAPKQKAMFPLREALFRNQLQSTSSFANLTLWTRIQVYNQVRWPQTILYIDEIAKDLRIIEKFGHVLERLQSCPKTIWYYRVVNLSSYKMLKIHKADDGMVPAKRSHFQLASRVGLLETDLKQRMDLT